MAHKYRESPGRSISKLFKLISRIPYCQIELDLF